MSFALSRSSDMNIDQLFTSRADRKVAYILQWVHYGMIINARYLESDTSAQRFKPN